jgi:hypothetical protein
MSDLPEGAGAPDDDLELGAVEEGDEPELLEEGNEPEPEVEDDGNEPVPEPRQTRQERRDERSRSRARELEAQNAELARRLAALETRQAQPVVDPAAAQRAEAQFYESLQTMLPHEAAIAVAQRTEQRMQAQLMQAELRGFDRADVAEFNALRARDRAADRLAPEVERLLAQNRAAGDMRFGRMDILDLLRGRELRTRGAQAAQQQRRNGAARVAAQTTRPAGAAGDVARSASRARNQDADDIALLRQVRAQDI